MTTVHDAIYILEENERIRLAMEIAERVIRMRKKCISMAKEQEETTSLIESALKADNETTMSSVLYDTRKFASGNFAQDMYSGINRKIY